MPNATRVSKWHWAAVAALAFGFFLAGIHRAPVPTVDGAVRASEAREILRTEQLWPIVYQGHAVTDHPPLFVWCVAASFKLLGVNDLAFNLVPRLAAALTVLMTAWIALESGLSGGAAVAAALILCLTRDFTLSSVRGYIEPLLELFIYAGLLCTLRQRRSRGVALAAAAGACVLSATFAKGPVALWPFLFYGILLGWNGLTASRRAQLTLAYLGAIAAGTGLWAAWVARSGQWDLWRGYFLGQILSSALEGRGGAQSLEPLFFAKVLLQYYWPWLPLLLWSFALLIRRTLELEFSRQLSYGWLFGGFGLGFVVAFSLMKWKFWYYIAPAYPSFALLVVTMLNPLVSRWTGRARFAQTVAASGAVWSLVATSFPIPLHRERVPEVMAFKDAILSSELPGPIWFVRDPMDHNMIGTSGQWYFDRVVEKVEDEGAWERDRLKGPAWVITGAEAWESCSAGWCRRATLVSKAGKSALVLYR